MEIIPCGHRVVIQPVALEEVDSTYATAKRLGIEIPELEGKKVDKNAVNKGTLVRIGINAWKGFDDGIPWANVGDIVLYARYAGVKVKDGDTEYLVCSDEDVVCVIKE